ncbi:MAG: pilus assembly PilX N-terminal domain-containing protein [bacterium]|nr:pilus assembly PilX N-terminal domain-containing protein [bacterium]
MKNIISNDKGVALLIAMAIMSMLTAVVMVSLDRSTTESEMSFNRMHDEQAFYVAEAGLKYGLVQLNSNADWRAGVSNFPIGEGEFTISLVDSTVDPALDDTIIISSIGWVETARAHVRLAVVPGVFNPFAFAMFGDDRVDIRSKMKTDSYNSDSGSYAATRDTLWGNLGSNNIIDINNNAEIGGDVLNSNVGGNYIHVGATVFGTVTDIASEQSLPLIAQSEFDWAEANNNNSVGISGSYSYNPISHDFQTTGAVQLSSGVYYFSSMILKNSASLTLSPGADVILYVTGDIELKNSAELNLGGKPSSLLVYSQGDFVLKNSGNISAVFYNPAGAADLRNSGGFYGAIVANTIVSHNSAYFHYDRSLAEFELSGGADFEKAGWQEIL